MSIFIVFLEETVYNVGDVLYTFKKKLDSLIGMHFTSIMLE